MKIFSKALEKGDRLMTLQAGLVHGRIGRRAFIQLAVAAGASLATAKVWAQELGDAAITQRYNAQNLATSYDYIVVGSGSGGAVVAGRLAAETDASVLVLEAGDTDQIDAVLNPLMWPTNIRSERDWGYSAEPSDKVNGRSLILPMGKVVGGGSSINVMIWARGHKNDFDHWAAETGDDGWNYKSVLEIYKRIEDWHGPADDSRRGTGGRLFMTEVQDPNPIAPAFLSACESVGIPAYADMNGEMMEGEGGAALANVRIKDGMRRNLPADYLWETLKRPNITLLTGATVHRVELDGTTVTGVTFEKDGEVISVGANERVVLSAGAINTPNRASARRRTCKRSALRWRMTCQASVRISRTTSSPQAASGNTTRHCRRIIRRPRRHSSGSRIPASTRPTCSPFRSRCPTHRKCTDRPTRFPQGHGPSRPVS